MDDRQEAFFQMLLIDQAEAALRSATVERRQTTVRVQGEGQFDFDYLRGKAKIAADNYFEEPGVRRARLSTQSMNNLKQMALGMHAYHDVNGGLPAPAVCSKDGKPLLSWRVAILPYIEQLAAV